MASIGNSGDRSGLVCPFFKMGLCSLPAEECPMAHEQKAPEPGQAPPSGLQGLADSLTAAGDATPAAGKGWSTAAASERQKAADTNQNYLDELCSVAEKALCLDKSGGAVSKLYSKRNNMMQVGASEDAVATVETQQGNASDQHRPPPLDMGWGHNQDDPDAIPPLISAQDIDSLKSLIEGDMKSFKDLGGFSRHSGANDLGAAAAAIADLKHFCYQCQRGGLVLTLGGKCPVCKGEFVEVEASAPQAGEWGVPPEATMPPPLARASGDAVDLSSAAPTRAPKLRKPGLPLRKPQEASVKPYYCYNCKTKAPFLCSNNRKCPTCKSDFVEEHDTANSHLEAEKEAERKTSEDVAQPRRANHLSKYVCHYCNKTSVVGEGQRIQCGHCHSDFVEEKSETNTTWADRVGAPEEAKPVEASNWQCHRCQRINRLLVNPGETPRCPFCNSEFVEQVGDEGPTADGTPVPTAPPAHQPNTWNGAPQSWPPAIQPPREDNFFRTGREFIQRATSGGDLGPQMEHEQIAGPVGLPAPAPANMDMEKVAAILDDVEAAAAKLDYKLKTRLGDDYCLKMSQCCQKPFQVVRRAAAGSGCHDTLDDVHRKVKGHIRAVTVVIFNNHRVTDEAATADALPYDEAVTELSSAIDLLEKLCSCPYNSPQLNRGGEYILRIIRASCNVRCGELRAAKQDIALALAIHEPKDATPFFLRGMILKRQGKEEEATKDALAAIKLDPQLALKLSADYL